MNPLGSKGKLAGAFAELVRQMWLSDMPYLTPLEFRVSSIPQEHVIYATQSRRLEIDMSAKE